ncbi:glycosyltransferase family 4 protein [Rothia sp. ZJ932]|uniref:glycosyltransferase family 4 protein n=1 Tax=Rothia sp. ZJ932 TaxID=2810516 RepID=UPI001967423A|nr:glycosyltransferase family 4 protein [Rothia sp. ZJ932]QRZ61207.1 glycosyltransferase family 4 protein [Rothia sp. ZJ932]
MKRKIVILSPILPEVNPANAGEKLVFNLADSLTELKNSVFIIAEDANSNVNKESSFDSIIVERRKSRRSKLVDSLDSILSPFSSWAPRVSFLMDVLSCPIALQKIKEADIVDLQWASMALLAPGFRLFNPKAKFVGTLHDVNSQRLGRRAMAEENVIKSFIWKLQSYSSKILEKHMFRFLDEVVVLSSKDKSLLSAQRKFPNKVAVVTPPIYDEFFGKIQTLNRTKKPTFLFMGSMYRWENENALRWLVDEVMPQVWSAHPEVSLRLVGPAPEKLVESLDSRVTYMGVVDQIADAYQGIWASLVPLKLGAGVKFKTVDALLAGVPVISTYAGIEGIVDTRWAAQIAESPSAYARSIIQVIESIDMYATKAQTNVPQISKIYGVEAYRERVRKVYGS